MTSSSVDNESYHIIEHMWECAHTSDITQALQQHAPVSHPNQRNITAGCLPASLTKLMLLAKGLAVGRNTDVDQDVGRIRHVQVEVGGAIFWKAS